uniref:InfA n=1 Tax=Oldenlandia corymbosa TaxID=43536 RepID=A0A899L799_OLDCO|nr:InfA [Oldenlandia corymbosa]QSM34911.1 InfA [Oldenlandia corymbosa]
MLIISKLDSLKFLSYHG